MGQNKRIFVLAALFSLVVLFQNCDSRTQFFGGQSSGGETTTQNSGGEPYEGKLYASEELCPNNEARAKIKFINTNSALLVKENCQILHPGVPLSGADFVRDPLDPTRLTYQSRQFVLEAPRPNQIFKAQWKEQYVPGPNISISSLPFDVPTAQGNLVICSFNYNSPNGTAEITSVTDNLGNTYRRAIGPTGGARALGVAGYTSETWYAENVNGGLNLSATATFSETMNPNNAIFCYEFGGIEPVNSLDQTAAGFGTSGTVDLSVSTNWSNELVYVSVWGDADYPAGFTYSASPGVESLAHRHLTSAETVSISVPVRGAMIGVVTFRAK